MASGPGGLGGDILNADVLAVETPAVEANETGGDYVLVDEGVKTQKKQ